MVERIRTRPGAGSPATLPALLAAASLVAVASVMVLVASPSAGVAQVARGQAVLGEPVPVPGDSAPVAHVGVAPGAEPLAALPAWAAETVQRLEQRLAADVAVDGVGSMAAAVVVDDSVIWQAAFGLADRETGARAGPATLYRAASISKSVTALVLLAMVERGIVGLDDPVEPYIPELRHLANRAPDHRPITFRDLASHTSGLAREPAASNATRGAYRDWRRKLVSAIPATDAANPPGEAYLYSNIGYSLLGLALERAADQPYETLVRTLALEPLGMESSTLVVPRSLQTRLAAGYVNHPGDSIDPRVPRAEHRGRGYQVPDAGLYSTVGDLARLAMAMTGALGDSPVTAASRATALTDQTARARAGTEASHAVATTGYGLGFQLHRIGNITVAGHSGTVAGYSAYLAFDPESRTGVVLLRNYNHGATNLGAAAVRVLLELAALR